MTEEWTQAAACAKINLALDITGRREDGYHLLRTVMQSVSLCDRVALAAAERGKIEVKCDGPDVPGGPDNTVFRAAEAFFQRTGIGGGARFQIRKQIPRQAGLGGGSADAAAALRLLDRRFGAGLSARELREIGLKVGADVPFCVEGGTALAGGIGEELEPLPALPPCAIVICKPGRGVSTREAYEAFDHSGQSGSFFADSAAEALHSGSLSAVAGSLGNAFEAACPVPEVRRIEEAMLSRGALGACMTGSGSAVFGLFASENSAARCGDALREEFPECFLCRPVSRIF